MAVVTGLVYVLLVLPALGAALAATGPIAPGTVARVTAVGAGVGWALVAATGDEVSSGDLLVGPLLAAAAAGTALLVLARRPTSVLGSVAGLLTASVLPAAAALDPSRLPDRRLAVGAATVAALAAIGHLAEGGRRVGAAVLVAVGAVLLVGIAVDEPGPSLALTAAGTAAAVAATATGTVAAGTVALAGLLAVGRVASARPPVADTDVALLAVAGAVVAGTGVLLALRHRPVAHRLPDGAALAAAALLAASVAELRAAGALLAAGAVLGIATRHPVALVALAPGAAAAAHAAGLATGVEHAAVGAAALAALAAGSVGPVGPVGPVRGRSAGERAPSGTGAVLVALAVAFAALPAWGWAGADTEAYRDAVAVALAVAVPVVVIAALAGTGRLPAIPRLSAGTIVRRPRADPSHGSPPHEPAAEAEVQEGAGTPAP